MTAGAEHGRKIVPLLIAPTAVQAGMPLQSALAPQAPPAELIATLAWWMITVFGLVFLVVMLIGGTGLWRGHRAAARTLSARASRNLVIAGGVIVPLVILIALVIGSVMVGRASTRAYADDALTVEVIGRRWWWELRYLGRDGKTLAVTANEIHLPAGEPVRLLLRSEDVIHSFWAPNLDGKTDMIPGMTNTAWLRSDQPGVYRGQCAEYCGTQHALMAFEVVVRPAAEFHAWLQRQAQPARADAQRHREGRRLFSAKGCAECHRIRGSDAQGARAPDLTHIASRRTLAAATVPNNRGHLAGWIVDPQNTKPGALMPPTALLAKELDALLNYLEALE